MRNLMLVFWLTILLVAWAYHRGPGQERLALDDTARLLEKADRLAAMKAWGLAEPMYEKALAALPADHPAEGRRIRLERAKVQLQNHKLPTAHEDLKALVDEMAGDPHADAAVLADARRALANSQYYMTWLLRLEGEPEARWRPEIESARQTFRLLAEEGQRTGNASKAKQDGEDLESTIRLARMDLHELQGLPLPSQ